MLLLYFGKNFVFPTKLFLRSLDTLICLLFTFMLVADRGNCALFEKLLLLTIEYVRL